LALFATSDDRFARQKELVPHQRLSEMLVTVIGVGAIGRQVALQLAAIGIRKLQLVDFDRVDWTNLATQGYAQEEIDELKVHATARAVARVDPTVEVISVDDRFRPKLQTGSAIFCCVDLIESRAAIWRSKGSLTDFWADGRMLGEAIRILVASDRTGRLYYPNTLFSAAEAEPGRCTARSTIYTANIAAALMVHQFVRWLRGQPTDADLSLNLLASELVVNGRDS
jgi:hypothetical protein